MWRNVLEPYGYHDELRAACVSDGSCWGALSLWRARGEAVFEARETAFLGRVASMLGSALRRITTMDLADEAADLDRCAVVILDDTGTVTSATNSGVRWLDQLFTDRDPGNRFSALGYIRAFAAAATPGTTTRTRLRGPDQRWHTLEASALTGGGTAVVIQPSQPDELIGAILMAYQLSPRELDVLGLVCQGLTSNEIAAQLCISPHTARDHVKHLLAKTGVSTRTELMARLFVDHYAKALHDVADARQGQPRPSL